MKRYFYATLILSSMLTACAEKSDSGDRGPIVLGDAATIVTEADSQYLSDFVVDIQAISAPPEESPAADTGRSIQQVKADTPVAKPVAVTPPPPVATGNGLSIPFKEVTVFIPGLTTRTYRTQNPATANGVTYELTGGKIAGNKLQITVGGAPKVSQRYSTAIIAKRGSETLELSSLAYTSDWKPLQGSGSSYLISGLDESKLEVKNVSPAQIRTAVSRAARSKRMSRADINEWEKAVRNTRSLKGGPFTSTLRSVMWKIDGKDASGKTYSKQIRIDIPVK